MLRSIASSSSILRRGTARVPIARLSSLPITAAITATTTTRVTTAAAAAAVSGVAVGGAIAHNRRCVHAAATATPAPTAAAVSASRVIPPLGRGSNTTSQSPVPYDTLAATPLQGVQPKVDHPVEAQSLWLRDGAIIMIIRRPFCVLCRDEAAQLTKLLAQCRKEGLQVKLVGVAKEETGTKEFREVFNGDIFVDHKKTFFTAGNRGAHMTMSEALFSGQVWKNLYRAMKNGHRNTTGGEGSLMGGLIVMGSTDQGVLFEYRERVFGDHANHDDVMAAVRRIKPNIHIVS